MKSLVKDQIAVLLILLALGPLAFPQDAASPGPARKLAPPPKGERLRVAFVLSNDAVMIDFAGPWEVFQDVMVPSRSERMEDQHPFDLYTVADSRAPIRASHGMRIIPDYTFDTAPAPQIVVVPAQEGRSPRMLSWLRKMSTQSDVVMSVCTGAFVLAEAGLLNGKKATTYHDALDLLQRKFPKISVQRGVRYVQSDPVIFTSAGLSSGIDLALHIVDLYFGHETAEATAEMMEYEGKGWMGDGKTGANSSSPEPFAQAAAAKSGK